MVPGTRQWAVPGIVAEPIRELMAAIALPGQVALGQAQPGMEEAARAGLALTSWGMGASPLAGVPRNVLGAGAFSRLPPGAGESISTPPSARKVLEDIAGKQQKLWYGGPELTTGHLEAKFAPEAPLTSGKYLRDELRGLWPGARVIKGGEGLEGLDRDIDFNHPEELATVKKFAIEQYKGGNYDHINQAVMGKEWDEKIFSKDMMNMITKDLDRVINNSTVNEDTVLFRGSQNVERNWDELIGKSIRFNKYLSTSANEQVAKDFSSVAGGAGVEVVGPVVEIMVPKGKRALSTSRTRGRPDYESEVVLPRDAQFRVMGVARDKKGTVRHVYLQMEE
jgi:hypothetical protein